MPLLVMVSVMKKQILLNVIMMVETVVDLISSMTIAQIAAANLFISIKVVLYPS